MPGSHLQEVTLIAWTLPLWAPGLLTVVVLTHLQTLPWPTFRNHSGFKWEAPKEALCIGSGLSQPCQPLLTSHLLKRTSPALWDDHCSNLMEKRGENSFNPSAPTSDHIFISYKQSQTVITEWVSSCGPRLILPSWDTFLPTSSVTSLHRLTPFSCTATFSSPQTLSL